MTYETRYVPGDYNVYCDRCGSKVKASQTRKEWNGLRVCKSHWEPRHPQDKIRGKVDRQAVSDPRPEPTELFLGQNTVTVDNFETVSGSPDTVGGAQTYWDYGESRWDVNVGTGLTIWD